MMYLVDFFDTLFDGKGFSSVAHDGPYEPGELASYMHPDATTFLREKENSVLIITSMTKETDASLIESALHGIPRTSVMYTGGQLKGEYLAPYISMYGQSPIFIDDSIDHLASMALHCPGVRGIEMRRDGREGDGRWPVIRSLDELSDVLR